MSMKLPECIVQGEFTAVVQTAVTRPVTDYSVHVRSRGQMLCERFFYVERGAIRFENGTPGGQTFTAGDIVYLPYDVTYRSRWDPAQEGRYTTVNFALADIRGQRFSLGEGIALLHRDRREEFFGLFRELSRKWTRGSFGYRLESAALLSGILYRLALYGETDNPRSGQRGVDKAILYLESNYLSEVTTAELAEMAGIGECMFRRAFRRAMGTTPVQYRNHLRLTKAREMLQSGEFTVLEAAMAAGFDDAGYFSRLFKREFGVSPSSCVR